MIWFNCYITAQTLHLSGRRPLKNKKKGKPMINDLRKILTDRITVKQEEKIKLVSKCPQVPQTDPQERKT